MGADTSLRDGPATSGRKRKHADSAANLSMSSSSYAIAAETEVYASRTYYDNQLATPPKKPRTSETPTEKRLRRFRPKPPQSFHDVYQRATTQRFYVLSRTRCGTADCPEEMVEMTGLTGNVYTVVVARQPSCDCPHALAGHQCKHVLYVLARVLRARHELVYQLALLSSELREIFADAPPPVEGGVGVGAVGGGGGGGSGRRKPVEGDCPICFCEMETEGGEPVVWCRAACGQNVHKGCFETWAATKRRQGNAEVTCPYCRSVWEGDADMIKKIERNGKRNAEGYVNVASQLGISPHRDYSTYSRWWSGHPDSYRGRY